MSTTEEIVPVLFTIPRKDGSIEKTNGYIIRQLQQTVFLFEICIFSYQKILCTPIFLYQFFIFFFQGPQAVSTGPAVLIPVPTPSTSTIQLLPTTGPSQPGRAGPSTKASRPNSLVAAKTSKKSSKEPLPLLPKPVGSNVAEPIQIATKFLLPVTSIQPILVAEPTVVQGGFVDGQNPSCSGSSWVQMVRK